MNTSLRVGIAGAGRMGQAIATLAADSADIVVSGQWSRDGNLAALAADSDVLIDFSLPEGSEQVFEAVRSSGTPLVCGVSGFSEEQVQMLESASTSIPVVYDRNMSQGITVLAKLVTQVAAALGQEFAISISEVHHVHKKDAPSGTALKLGEAIEANRQDAVGDIDYHSERRGEVPGDHTVGFVSDTESLSFSHSVTTRDVFAQGALVAARWVVDKPAGLYSMQDVLFEKS